MPQTAGGGAIPALLLGRLPQPRLNAWLSDAYVIPGNAHEDELSDVPALDNGDEAG